jgi:hypothetical protein
LMTSSAASSLLASVLARGETPAQRPPSTWTGRGRGGGHHAWEELGRPAPHLRRGRGGSWRGRWGHRDAEQLPIF